MVQKTYHLSPCTPERLGAVLEEIAGLPAYRNAAQVLLLMLEQNWNAEAIRRKTQWIERALNKAEIVGITHFDGLMTGGEIPENTILTLFFFDAPAFEVRRFSMAGASEAAVGRALGMAMAEQAYLRCVLTAFSCSPRDIGLVLETAERGNPDVPFFGATAGVRNFFENGAGLSFIFDRDGVYQDTLLAVLLRGEQLHVQAAYNYGWTPVGKTLTVTRLRDPYTVEQIDGRPAADVYEKYLGIPWRTNSLSLFNICEFPLTTALHGLRMARIPYAWDSAGNLHFAIAMHEGESLRLTYGLPQQIFSQIHENRDAFLAFHPEAMLLVVCMNRMIFLREEERRETDAYRAVVPEAAYLHGNSEIFRYHGAGGEMHSALVAVGFREGAAPEEAPLPVRAEERPVQGDRLIPLENRLMTFIRAVTSDLEEVTEELRQLSGHLEDEVLRKTRENERLSLHVVQTLAEAIDAKDNYTSGHSGRVARYSREIAERAGYSKRAQHEIYMMGLLHDVGKIGVSDAVINKPGALTDAEFAEIRNHPVMGAKILSRIQEMPKLETGAHWHHERYDGTGYPDGLAGTQIPEEARIIAIADAYDAMTSNRSYRRSLEQHEVRERIKNGRGTQFDPRFTDIMLDIIDEDTQYRKREL